MHTANTHHTPLKTRPTSPLNRPHKHKLVTACIALLLVNPWAALPAQAQTEPPAASPPAAAPQPPGLITPDVSQAIEAPSDPAAKDAEAQPEFSMAPAEALVQGAVTLDVVAPDSLTAGDKITYTFKYKNETSLPTSGIVLDVSFTNYGNSSAQHWQYCEPETCEPQFPFGPVVTLATSGTFGVNARYLIGDLTPGQSGEFKVVLRTYASLYPKTGKSVIRPAASGKLYLNNNTSSVVSNDTANSLVVGPVFYLTKVPVSNTTFYVGDVVEFIIRLGNATGPGDSVTGTLRADARTATGIVLTDKFPEDSDFEFASDGPAVDTAERTVTWLIPGSLAPGQTIERRVAFRKLNIYHPRDCSRVQNLSYYATSNEFPLVNNQRADVNGDSVTVNVIPQVQVKAIRAIPSTVYFGDPTQVTLLVQNYYTRSLSNVKLSYTLQSNMRYVPGTALPAPDSAPLAGVYGGEMTWTFNMAAGSKTAPASQLITMTLQAGFVAASEIGIAKVTDAEDLPVACSRLDSRIKLESRIKIDKIVDPNWSEEWPVTGGDSLVDRASTFSFLIRIHNRGTLGATGLTIEDELPSSISYPSDFRYVVGSATLNNVPRPPDRMEDGNDGYLIWDNLDVPAGATLEIRYQMIVNGTDYESYCNEVFATMGGEAPSIGSNQVCIKINPRLRLTLVADKEFAQPGDPVVFTTTLTNEESQTYTLGLANALNQLVWSGVQLSGYATPTFINLAKIGPMLQWPVVELGGGQTISASFLTHLPNPCTRRTYIDEAMFLVGNGNNLAALVRPIPAVKRSVTCGTLEYSKEASRQVIGLRDIITYTLSVRNGNGNEVAQNIIITDVMPPGLTYIGMEQSSEVRTAPIQSVRPDGRRQLVWKLSTLSKLDTATIRFMARSGDVVGAFENWMTASASNSPGGRCISVTCKVVEEDGQPLVYASASGQIQSLITTEPQLTDLTCARPGDTRTYRLTILNTNDRAYSEIGVTVKLPLGLRYVQPLTQTAEPLIETDSEGATLLHWRGLQVAAKPPATFASQTTLMLELQVGNALSDLEIEATASNPETVIPRKDAVNNPTVVLCLPDVPTLTKEVSRQRVSFDQELVYQISIANPTSNTLLTSFSDVLPGNFTYQGTLSGPEPSVNGNTLTWDSLGVPATSVLRIKFVVRARGERGTTYVNTIQLFDQDSMTMDTANASASTFIENELYLYMPLLTR